MKKIMQLSLVPRLMKTSISILRMRSYSTLTDLFKPKEAYIKIGGWNIHYVKVGNGSHNILCIPGGFGTIWTDYTYQVKGFDLDKFTFFSIDSPGYGKSIPPKRSYTKNFHESDADIAHTFMQIQGVPQYSLMGWSYGSIAAMIYAAKYPDFVNKMVIWGSHSHISPYEKAAFENIRYITSWSPEMMKSRVELYGEELTAQYSEELIEAIVTLYEDGDICSKYLKYISCPALILHGEKDPLVGVHHAYFLQKQIKKSRLHLFPEGKHNIHLRYPKEFNRVVQEF